MREKGFGVRLNGACFRERLQALLKRLARGEDVFGGIQLVDAAAFAGAAEGQIHRLIGLQPRRQEDASAGVGGKLRGVVHRGRRGELCG